MKTRLIIVAVLLFFSLFTMLHFSLSVKGQEEPMREHESLHSSNPSLPGPGWNLAPDPNATGQLGDIFAHNNTQGH